MVFVSFVVLVTSVIVVVSFVVVFSVEVASAVVVSSVHGASCHFQHCFSYIVVVSSISGENRSSQRKPPTCRKSLTNVIT
jgi:hypothetical protein